LRPLGVCRLCMSHEERGYSASAKRYRASNSPQLPHRASGCFAVTAAGPTVCRTYIQLPSCRNRTRSTRIIREPELIVGPAGSATSWLLCSQNPQPIEHVSPSATIDRRFRLSHPIKRKSSFHPDNLRGRIPSSSILKHSRWRNHRSHHRGLA